MDDMNAFERQVARDALRDAGPSHPVDAAAVFARAVPASSPKWRFGSMFSATKFVVAGAIVALFGGFLLIGQPFDQQGESVPGASTDPSPMAPVYVKVNFLEQYGSYGTESETDEGMTRQEGGVLFGGADSTDPRLGDTSGREGLIVMTSDLRIDGETGIGTSSIVIFNDGGRWVGTGVDGSIGTSPLDADRDFSMVVLSGMEGYEGLTAVLLGLDDQSEWDLGGVIFEGDMPAIPEDWCALARDDYPAAVTRFGDDPNIRDMEDATRRGCPSVEIPE